MIVSCWVRPTQELPPVFIEVVPRQVDVFLEDEYIHVSIHVLIMSIKYRSFCDVPRTKRSIFPEPKRRG